MFPIVSLFWLIYLFLQGTAYWFTSLSFLTFLLQQSDPFQIISILVTPYFQLGKGIRFHKKGHMIIAQIHVYWRIFHPEE